MKNRYIMGGLPFFEHEPVHLDLLYTSRRIWRGYLPDFTLSTVEMRALDFKRSDDIPGWQIPDVYASYLRGRSVADELTAVFHHNKNDVLTLLALLLKQLNLVYNAAAVGTSQTERYNPIAISDMFITSGKKKRARDILHAHTDDSEALKRLALLYKRERSFEKALSQLERLSAQRVELSDYIFACTEAAKIYEHVYKDFDKALVYTEKMRGRVDRVQLFYSQHNIRIERERDLIVKRIGRLQRKLERNKGE
jgi:tetratricopeptide (TPR) repeat protein